MSAPSVKLRSWHASPRWIFNILIIFFVHLYAILWLSRFSSLPAPQRPTQTQIYSVPEQEGMALPIDEASLSDPTLFAMPHEEGFSGTAWLRHAGFSYRMATPVPPPQWRSPDASALAGDLPFAGRSLVADESRGPTRLPPVALRLPVPSGDSACDGSSGIKMDGALADRVLSSPLRLPAIEAGALLTNTVVRLLVNAAGEPVSAVLWQSSGSVQADQKALQLAKAARFEPLPGSESTLGATVGMLTFQWFTAPRSDGDGGNAKVE
jgi:TonB family protein